MSKHVTLTGMMGSGKSSIAPPLGRLLGRDVIEVDQLIERHEGQPISDIFMDKGEAYFRRLERDFIAELMTHPPTVLSLGGGAFLWDETRELLLEETVVFYLATTKEILYSRLKGNVTRPLLSVPGVDLEKTIADILRRRAPYYEQAHYTITTDHFSPEQLAEAIAQYRAEYE